MLHHDHHPNFIQLCLLCHVVSDLQNITHISRPNSQGACREQTLLHSWVMVSLHHRKPHNSSTRATSRDLARLQKSVRLVFLLTGSQHQSLLIRESRSNFFCPVIDNSNYLWVSQFIIMYESSSKQEKKRNWAVKADVQHKALVTGEH